MVAVHGPLGDGTRRAFALRHVLPPRAPSWQTHRRTGAAQAAEQNSPVKTEANSAGGETVRVFDPQGKPAAGVKFYRSDTVFHSLYQEPGAAVLLGQSGPDGSFLLSSLDVKAASERKAQIVAMADGCGPGFRRSVGRRRHEGASPRRRMTCRSAAV